LQGFVLFGRAGEIFGCAAPGFRDAGYYGRLGTLMSVGLDGYSWSSAVSGTNGVFLYFDAQHFNPSHVGFHGHGFQLRCLSE